MAKRKTHKRRKESSRALSVGGKKVRRRKRRGLSEGFGTLVKPDIKTNPLFGGVAGGAGSRVVYGLVPKGVTEALGKDGKPTLLAKFARPLAIAAVGAVAHKMKQPQVAAACFGVATFVAMGAAGMLADDSFLQTTRYADPNLLNDDVAFYDEGSGQWISLSDEEAIQIGVGDTMMLSRMSSNNDLEDEDSPYPNYSNLQDTMMLSDEGYNTYQIVD